MDAGAGDGRSVRDRQHAKRDLANMEEESDHDIREEEYGSTIWKKSRTMVQSRQSRVAGKRGRGADIQTIAS